MSNPSLLAGLDIGGSKVLAVAVEVSPDDQRPRVVEQVRLTTFQGPEGVVDTASRALTALAGRLVERNGWHGGPAELFSGVGIGVPGLVDAERGAVTHAVNLGVGPGGLALADRLQRRLNLPVVVENDVNAAACGVAAHLRLGRVDLGYLSIGTGLAAGIVLDGVLRRTTPPGRSATSRSTRPARSVPAGSTAAWRCWPPAARSPPAGRWTRSPPPSTRPRPCSTRPPRVTPGPS